MSFPSALKCWFKKIIRRPWGLVLSEMYSKSIMSHCSHMIYPRKKVKPLQMTSLATQD